MKLDQETIKVEIDRIVEKTGTQERYVIPILHAIQKKFNYLPEYALRRVCQITEISPAAITGIYTFYSQFRHSPVGEHIIQICTGTACHVKGAELVWEAFCRKLRLKEDQDTDAKGEFTIRKVACLGCCTIAPVIQIDTVTYGKVNPAEIDRILADFRRYRSKKKDSPDHSKEVRDFSGEIKIGLGSCCIASGSEKVQHSLDAHIAGLDVQTRVKRVGCVGMCHLVPLLEINKPDQEPVLYDKVQPEDVKGILSKHFKPKTLAGRLKHHASNMVDRILDGAGSNGYVRHSTTVRDPNIDAFLGRQKHIATEHSGQVDPLDLEEYRIRNGFKALDFCLKDRSPVEIINTIRESGLRGRGGAGFPTGEKWQIAHQASADTKYIICNGDEGDPGAFMDRMILESYPFRVIEGMVICAFAVGANQGFLYIRAEYPLAVQRVEAAIRQCRESGLLGNNILGKGFDLDLTIMQGAGAFVCGEETALIASIEGRRGMPKYRPPYPAEKGLWDFPTLVNNCETLATVPWIIRNGTGSFVKLGTERSKGTKVFSLAGKIARGGLIEVPMGITIREIVEEIGGGIEHNRQFKAVQIGGPSGGCVPAELADTKVDYEDLTQVGAMMGSGGLLVMDETDCMVDIARYFLDFTCHQSCGKCTFCRIGTQHMLNILENLCKGIGRDEDLQKLEEVAKKTKQGSLCGLGQTAPNPVLTTLKYYRQEYEAHLRGECPAKRCKELISYSISSQCIGCTICAQKCPVGAIAIDPYVQHKIDQEWCIKCGTCKRVCPNDAVMIT